MGLLRDNGFITDIKTKIDGVQYRAYNVWYHIIQRCYNENNPSYKTYGAKGVYVCEEWKLFSNFKKWYDENYIEDFYIDKDIKVPGNKCYGPEFCMFVSQADNNREATSRRDNSYLKEKTGVNHHSHRPMNHYETKASRRHEFKRNCKSNGWNFEDFKEVFSGIKTSQYTKLFYYYYEGGKR